MLQIYKISQESSGGGRLCLNPPEGIKLQEGIIHSYPFLTPYHELARTANPRVLLPSCSFLGAIFMVALGRAALLPWHQPAQLLGEKEMCSRPKQGARDSFSTRADLSGRLSPCASSKQRLAPHHLPLQRVVLTSQAHQL